MTRALESHHSLSQTITMRTQTEQSFSTIILRQNIQLRGDERREYQRDISTQW